MRRDEYRRSVDRMREYRVQVSTTRSNKSSQIRSVSVHAYPGYALEILFADDLFVIVLFLARRLAACSPAAACMVGNGIASLA